MQKVHCKLWRAFLTSHIWTSFIRALFSNNKVAHNASLCRLRYECNSWFNRFWGDGSEDLRIDLQAWNIFFISTTNSFEILLILEILMLFSDTSCSLAHLSTAKKNLRTQLCIYELKYWQNTKVLLQIFHAS